VVLERKALDPEGQFDVACDGGGIAALHVEAHVDASRNGFAVDRGQRRHDPDVRHILQPDPGAAGRVDQHLANVREAVTRLRRAPHHDVEDLLFLEEQADG
jgi:hypothetical protein